ncbi:MAG TPA: NAD(P)H-dependent oxidoreductase [Usitatibacter sp.]|nr:NAD(P)H-dependent oxidoreductase [Usitatibacter sp.]
MSAAKKILLIQGHPDPAPERFCRKLAAAYADGAREAGHEFRAIDIATLDFPLLRERAAWEKGLAPAALRPALDAIACADHLVFVFPLWLGDMPALLKGFLEQAMRPGTAFRYRDKGMPEKLLKGKSARIVVTMGMPAPIYEWFFRAHSLKSLERNILGFVGVSPVRRSVVGMVEGSDEHRRKWLAKLRRLGAQAR